MDHNEAMEKLRIEMRRRYESETVYVTVIEQAHTTEYEFESVIVVGIKRGSYEESDKKSKCIIQSTAHGNFDDTHSRHIAAGIKGMLKIARLQLVKKYFFKRGK